MLNDYVYENLVARDNGKLGKIFPWVSYTALVLFIIIFNVLVLVLFGNFIFISGMLSFGLWFLVNRANRNMRIEYELNISNDSVTMTKIIDQRKRVSACDFSIREDSIYIGPVTSDKFNDHLIESDYIVNGTADSPFKSDDPNIWYCYVGQMGMKYIMLFNFKPEMYPNFRRYAPRKIEAYVAPAEETMEEDE